MKRSIRYFLYATLLLIQGCYDDLGDYDYHDVNELKIDVPKNVYYRIPRTDSVEVIIVPNIEQTLVSDKKQISYNWERRKYGLSMTNEWDHCGTGDTCRIWMKPEDEEKQQLRLTVTDHSEAGSIWYKEIMLIPVFPYSRCWFVLQDNAGQAVLGAVDGVGEGAMIIEDVYMQEKNMPLPISGKPRLLTNNLYYGDALGYFNKRQPVFIVLTEQDAQVYAARTFEKKWNAAEMLYGLSKQGNTDFNLELIHSRTNGGAGEIIVDRGKTYCANADGYSIYYPLIVREQPDQQQHITHLIDVGSTNYFMFDALNRRFLRMTNSFDFNELNYNQMVRLGVDEFFTPSKKYSHLRLIPESSNNIFDPNNIEEDKQILHMGVEQGNKVLVFAYSKVDNKLHIYELDANALNNNELPYCSAKSELTIPGTVNPQELSFATGYVFHRIFFMASGNTLYKVDLNRAVPSVVELYKLPDPAKITHLQIKLNYTEHGGLNPDTGEWESYGLMYQLGMAVNYAPSEYGIIDIQLTTAGNVDKAANAIYEYKGFKNEIVDICFNVN